MKKNNIVLSHIVVARHCVSDKLLFSKKYSNLADEGHKISDASYCTAKNISQSTAIMDNKVIISIKFDLVVVYETIDYNNTTAFQMFTEETTCTINIEKKYYEYLPADMDIKTLSCKNLIKNVKCSQDIDVNCKDMIISVTANIESMLLKEGMVELGNGHIKDNCKRLPYRLPIAPSIPIEEDNLNENIRHLNSLIEKISTLKEDNQKLEKEAQSKDKKINNLEYRLGQIQDQYHKASTDLNIMESSIKDLSLKLEKCQRERDTLQNANSVLNQEMKVLLRENESLKLRIESDEDRKKNQVSYKIKSAINNIKLLF